jgi:hypothetical protein
LSGGAAASAAMARRIKIEGFTYSPSYHSRMMSRRYWYA